MPKVILILPSQYEADGTTLCKEKQMYLPGLALPLLAAMVPAHWQVKIIIEIIDKVDFDEECDLVGLGAMGYSVFRAMDIAKAFKARGKIVFMGGLMAIFLPDYIMQYVDSLVVGNAEVSFPKLLDDFEKTGKIERMYDHPVDTLENLPVPRYDLLPKEKINFMMPVQATRGCPFTCTFCSTSSIHQGRYAVRPVDEVIRDIKIIRQMGYKRFTLLDDNMAGNIPYLETLLKRIIPLKMSWAGQCTINIARHKNILKLLAKSGCKLLSVGIEGINQEGLDEFNKSWMKTADTEVLLKNIRKAGIAVFASFLIGTDNDTVETIRKTSQFITKNKISIPVFNLLTPLPGTDLFKKLKQENRLLHENFSRYNGFTCVHRPARMTPETTDAMYWWIYNDTYSITSILKRNLFVSTIFTTPLINIFALYTNFHYRSYIKKGIGPLII
jgi:radical SAM superfamily enzyme YgiQ (UPF0313 family)